MSIALKLLISIIIFFFLTGFLYKGAVGRIERRNQGTGSPDYLIMQVTGIKSLKTLQGYIRFDKKLNKTISEAWD